VFGDAVQREKAGIVRGELILDTGVAETNNQFHAALPLCEHSGAKAPSVSRLLRQG
jgi:hypothetical protein